MRNAQGLTLDDVAALTGLSAAMLSRVENGQRQASLGTVELLATALGCSSEDLLPTQTMEVVGMPVGDSST